MTGVKELKKLLIIESLTEMLENLTKHPTKWGHPHKQNEQKAKLKIIIILITKSRKTTVSMT